MTTFLNQPTYKSKDSTILGDAELLIMELE